GVGGEVVQPFGPRFLSDSAQDCVDQPRGAGADLVSDQGDGFVDGGVGGHPHAEQLVAAQTQGVQYGPVELGELPVHAAAEDGVVGALTSQAAVGELGGEAGVALVQPGTADGRGEHQVCVGV